MYDLLKGLPEIVIVLGPVVSFIVLILIIMWVGNAYGNWRQKRSVVKPKGLAPLNRQTIIENKVRLEMESARKVVDRVLKELSIAGRVYVNRNGAANITLWSLDGIPELNDRVYRHVEQILASRGFKDVRCGMTNPKYCADGMSHLYVSMTIIELSLGQ